ncbi:VOC family protein [Cellulomonas shaoxiangyii]|uniref:Glyoxalase n=1 Tax=Cellulomonas shaoxiangyii TaxID=2566013 RepID=A0A4P7SJR4_9CELL|nr:VOC family protein [Cellulomonas shaoxiangyii]QCB93356.1 glyoxalase [Cellulomonas shaoxiangyii]TGY85318.1 glyoxalase [Cellulomonas shaoxiangyii]
MATARGALHHVELWLPDDDEAWASFTWLLPALGYERTSTWRTGSTWTLGATYVVLETGPDVLAGAHDRRRPGVNHLAFHAGTRADVDTLVVAAERHGWTLMFPDAHPFAGGPEHYAAYLENAAGFEVELVADEETDATST